MTRRDFFKFAAAALLSPKILAGIKPERKAAVSKKAVKPRAKGKRVWVTCYDDLPHHPNCRCDLLPIYERGKLDCETVLDLTKFPHPGSEV